MNKQSIKLPELGEGVTEGELVKWLVSKGDKVQMDQPVAEVTTDKAVMEIPSPVEGEVAEFLVKVGAIIPVGTPILNLGSEQGGDMASKPASASHLVKDDDLSSSSEPPAGLDDSLKPTLAESSKGQGGVSADNVNSNNIGADNAGEQEIGEGALSPQQGSALATPQLRRLAKDLGIDLGGIKGSGVGGRILLEDIKSSASRKPLSGDPLSGYPLSGYQGGGTNLNNQPSPLGFRVTDKGQQERVPLAGIRKKIADKLQMVKQVVPHFTLLDSADVKQLEHLKNTVKEELKEKDIKVTYLAFVMKALLQTVKEFSYLNAGIDDFSQEIVIRHDYHFGFAVDTSRGLLVPVVRDVDQKSVEEISRAIEHLALSARDGSIKAEDMRGGSITITNIGSLGGEYGTPVINAPESSILGMYRIYTKPYWDGSAFVPRKTMNFSLTCDHRLIDGALAAKALKFFVHKIENPLSLFI